MSEDRLRLNERLLLGMILFGLPTAGFLLVAAALSGLRAWVFKTAFMSSEIAIITTGLYFWTMFLWLLYLDIEQADTSVRGISNLPGYNDLYLERDKRLQKAAMGRHMLAGLRWLHLLIPVPLAATLFGLWRLGLALGITETDFGLRVAWCFCIGLFVSTVICTIWRRRLKREYPQELM